MIVQAIGKHLIKLSKICQKYTNVKNTECPLWIESYKLNELNKLNKQSISSNFKILLKNSFIEKCSYEFLLKCHHFS